MHSVVAVALHYQAGEQSSLDPAKSLPAFCPNVQIILLCDDKLDRLPSYVDACVSTGHSHEKVTSEVRGLLSAKRPYYAAHNADFTSPITSNKKRAEARTRSRCSIDDARLGAWSWQVIHISARR